MCSFVLQHIQAFLQKQVLADTQDLGVNAQFRTQRLKDFQPTLIRTDSTFDLVTTAPVDYYEDKISYPHSSLQEQW